MNDPDHILKYIVKCDNDNTDDINWVLNQITKRGSIETYMNMMDDPHSTWIIKIMYQSGFKVTPANRIIYHAKCDKNGGDTPYSRIKHLIHYICESSVMLYITFIDVKYSEYQCFDSFEFNKPYSLYEYTQWFDSMCDIIENHHINHDIVLKLKDTSIDMMHVTDIIKCVIPQLKYFINGEHIYIRSNDLHFLKKP